MVIGVHHYPFVLQENSYQITEVWWLVQRTRSLERSLKREPVKREHFFAFMQELLDNNHAEIAPPPTMDEECWYLPVFGIYHPKKQGQIRCVFDSSATFEGVSLISELLSGPQLTNSLLFEFPLVQRKKN